MHTLIVANRDMQGGRVVDKEGAVFAYDVGIIIDMNGRVLTIEKDATGQLTIFIRGDLTQDKLDTLRADVTVTHAFLEHESQKAGKPLRMLTDVTAFTGTYAPNALLILADYMKKNAQYIEKSAIFGGDEGATFIAEIVSSLSNRDNVNFFKTREEALAWLSAN